MKEIALELGLNIFLRTVIAGTNRQLSRTLRLAIKYSIFYLKPQTPFHPQL